MLHTGSLTIVLAIFSEVVFSEFMSWDLSGRAGKRVLSTRYTCVEPACRRRSAAPQWRSAANGLSSGCAPLRAATHGWQTSAQERRGSSGPLPPSSGRRGPGLRYGAGEVANSLARRLRGAQRDGFPCV